MRAVVCIFIGLLAACSGEQSSGGDRKGPLPQGVVEFKRMEIIDLQGFGKRLVAATALIPANWQGGGEIQWGQGSACSEGWAMQAQAGSADGLSGMYVVPQQTWVWSNQGASPLNQCPGKRINSTRDYLADLVASIWPGAQIIDYRSRPDIDEPMQGINYRREMMGGEIRNWVESGEALVAWQQNGVDMRASVTATVIFNASYMPSPIGMAPFEAVGVNAFPTFIVQAPHGQLSFDMAKFIYNSARPGAEWGQLIAQHAAKIAGIRIDGAKDISKIISQSSNDVRGIVSGAFASRSQVMDSLSRERSEVMRGVETYNDPIHGGTVELDNTYDHAWQTNDGTYIMSNNPNFDPRVDLGIDATEMTVTR